jgi:hypothetical protein
MEPVRVRGGSSQAPLVFGGLVLAGVVAIGAGPRFFGGSAGSSVAPLAAAPSASSGGSPASAHLTPPLPAVFPSYPPPAVASSTFWVEIRRNGHVLQKAALTRQPDGSRTGTIPIPAGWRTKLPIVSLLGRTVPENHPSRLFSIRLALPETPRIGPAVNLAGGLSVIMDPVPAPTGSFDPGPMINYVHTWSYSADLEWAVGGGPELFVKVAPQLGI